MRSYFHFFETRPTHRSFSRLFWAGKKFSEEGKSKRRGLFLALTLVHKLELELLRFLEALGGSLGTLRLRLIVLRQGNLLSLGSFYFEGEFKGAHSGTRV